MVALLPLLRLEAEASDGRSICYHCRGFKMGKAISRDRRDFLKHGTMGLAGSTLLARASSARGVGEGSPEPKPGDFIDAHVHVWTDDVQRYPLAEGYTKANMEPPSFTPNDILERARPSGVRRVTLVQMSFYRFDNSYMLDAIRQRPDVFRGIAVVDHESRDPDVQMRKLASQGVRGFRFYPIGESPSRSLDRPGIDKMFACGAQHRLAMCLLINPQDLPAVDRKCEAFPGTPVVIDHLARVGKDGPILESDVRTLCGLARHKHVKVKVSAFYALGKKKPPHEDLISLIRRLYEAFGPQRLMWASDCPFQVENETYEDSISLVRDRLDFLTAEDKEWMLRRTAEETFFH